MDVCWIGVGVYSVGVGVDGVDVAVYGGSVCILLLYFYVVGVNACVVGVYVVDVDVYSVGVHVYGVGVYSVVIDICRIGIYGINIGVFLFVSVFVVLIQCTGISKSFHVLTLLKDQRFPFCSNYNL